MSTFRLRALAAAVAGGAVCLMLATPAQAQVPVGGGQNDGEMHCLVTGEIANPYHLLFPSTGTVSDFKSLPAGRVIVFPENAFAVQILPPGTTSTTGISFKWTSNSDPTETAVFTANAVQQVPTCGDAKAAATFASTCDDRSVDVTLINNSTAPLTFFVNGTATIVAAGTSMVVPDVAPDGSDNVAVTVDDVWAKDLPVASYHWTACRTNPTPTPAASPSETSESPAASPSASTLAETGSDVGGIVGVGAALLAFGGVLVALSVLRRRRQTA